MKTTTLALAVIYEDGNPYLLDYVSDDQEIVFLEQALEAGKGNPLQLLYEMRTQVEQRETELGDSIENLLIKRWAHPQIRKQGLEWFSSKIRIENYRKIEKEASQAIVDYAYKFLLNNPNQRDFLLQTQAHQVRIRVLQLPSRAA